MPNYYESYPELQQQVLHSQYSVQAAENRVVSAARNALADEILRVNQIESAKHSQFLRGHMTQEMQNSHELNMLRQSQAPGMAAMAYDASNRAMVIGGNITTVAANHHFGASFRNGESQQRVLPIPIVASTTSVVTSPALVVAADNKRIEDDGGAAAAMLFSKLQENERSITDLDDQLRALGYNGEEFGM
jgi:hypothetical protein